MNEFWILILVAFFATNLLNKAEAVKLELKTFDEIFGEGCWDKGEAEDLKTPAPTNFGQNVHHQIDRQNTQIGQIEPNSTDQLGQIEPNSTDQLGQIEPNSTDQLGQIEPNSTDQLGQIEPNSIDQNPPLTESDHSGQIEPNSTDQNPPPLTETDHFGQIEPNSTDQNPPPLTETDHFGQIEPNSTDQNPPPLTESDHSDNAKNGEEQPEMSSNENIAENERKRKIVAKFHGMREEFKQKGKYSRKEWVQIEQKIAKNFNLGLSLATIGNWKRKFGQTAPNKHSHNKQEELMKRYYQIKDKNPTIRNVDIAKMLKIGKVTLYKWKKQFQPNFVDSVEENAAANVQEIGKTNSGTISLRSDVQFWSFKISPYIYICGGCICVLHLAVRASLLGLLAKIKV
uniref:Uncharacterized protein n=1 Tax=Globodera rostochiensis TaxID=31243 RepID=A0A914H3X6_GLORO